MKGSEIPSLIPLKVMNIYKSQITTETMHRTFEKQTRPPNPPLKKEISCSRHTQQPWQRHLYSKIILQHFHKQICVAGRGNPILLHWAEKGWRSKGSIVCMWWEESSCCSSLQQIKIQEFPPDPRKTAPECSFPSIPLPSTCSRA